MPYSKVEDIPGIESSSVNIRKTDALMSEMINSTKFALKHRYNFNKKIAEESQLISFLNGQLLLYRTTHRSIRLLLAHAYRKKDYTVVPDAASLVREQVEKIYMVALVLSNPHKWIKQYLRNAWRSDYERFLLEIEEHGDNPRYEEFLQKHYPEFLTKGQRPPVGRGKPKTIVSDYAKRVVTYVWNNPAGKNPSWFKPKKAIRNYVRDYFEFPTPGKATGELKDRNLKRFLYRWHKEYSFISQYSHVTLEKVTIPMMNEYKDISHTEKVKINGVQLSERTVFTSHIAAATSCALILSALKQTYGAKNTLKEFWAELYGSSLLGKAFWNMYVKGLLE
jgi:hypothetical protein